MLYPLKFNSIYKKKVWGGNKLENFLCKKNIPSNKIGESWEISALKNNISVVVNGRFAGKNLKQIIDIEKEKLIGKKVYLEHGNNFPLLIKFIDANENLSVQVHPNNKIAKKYHNLNGKTEMWYIIDAEIGSEIITGLNKNSSKEEYFELLKKKKLKNILNFEKVKAGDVFFIPARRIHSICKGILLAEIQQTSDLTYRIYDWERTGKDGNKRELHTKLAGETIDFNKKENYTTNYSTTKNKTNNLITCNYFTTNFLEIDRTIMKNYSKIDSFIIYMCIEGEFYIDCNNIISGIKKGETVLIPAELKNIKLIPNGQAKLLEVYV